MKIKKLTVKDFEEAFGENLSPFLRKKIESCNLAYQELTSPERDNLIMNIMRTLSDEQIQKSGAHRANDWVRGWAENSSELSETNNFNSLIPKYFGKFPYVRWKQNFIKPVNKSFEYNMARILQYWLFEKHFKDSNSVYEFGCGTGHNLFRVNEINKDANVYGLDWAESSQDNIKKINNIFDKNFGSHRFDFFNVEHDYTLDPKSGVYTFAALEQVGSSHTEFLKYLLSQKPSICVHIEPIGEMLNPGNNFVDYLSVQYFRKRNYLDGLANTLANMEAAGEIEIVQQQRSFIGSLYVDGYSIIAWRPKNA